MPDNILQQIEDFHSEWSKMDLSEKIGFLMSRQRNLDAWAKSLAYNRFFRGYFTPEEKAAVRLLQDIQNDLDQHKAEVNQDIYKEISKALLSAIVNR
ncbi:MAG: hypothetical protein Q4D30_06225 [Bacteroidales bacterium]|nr:hypothetical protein [Bacteroidales bacterium]